MATNDINSLFPWNQSVTSASTSLDTCDTICTGTATGDYEPGTFSVLCSSLSTITNGIPKVSSGYGSVSDKKRDKFEFNKHGYLLGNCQMCGKVALCLPPVKSVEAYNDRVVLARFEDGTWTKSVTSENDIFDIDMGITICMIKRILGDQKKGTKLYNKYLKQAHKKMRENEKAEQERKDQEKKEREKQHKYEMGSKAKMMKHKEEQIDIVKQGVERALRESDAV